MWYKNNHENTRKKFLDRHEKNVNSEIKAGIPKKFVSLFNS